MNITMPDTIQGAVMISVIDFFLSFIIISGIGVVLYFFKFLDRIPELFRATVPAKAVAGEAKAVGDVKVAMKNLDDIAAISAAVGAVITGPHRVLYISERKHSWSQQGRDAQHAHQPQHK